MVQSMSRVGRCIDNGPMEGFWGILKSEMYYLRKFSSEQTLTSAIEEYIHFYNTKRYQKRLRCMTPMEFTLLHEKMVSANADHLQQNIFHFFTVYLTEALQISEPG